MNYLNEVLTNIEGLREQGQIDAIYARLKSKSTELNVIASSNFRLRQNVEFRADGIRYKGYVESIGRTGRIKVALLENTRYSHYTIGANALVESIKMWAA